MRAWSLRFRSSFSGALSCTKSASATAASSVLAKLRRFWLAPGSRPSLVSAGQALATPARIFSSAPGAGSVATTSSPWARQRAAQPLPITPPPTRATRRISVVSAIFPDPCFDELQVLAQAQFLARLRRRQAAGTHEADDLHGPLDQRAVARMHAAIEPDIVLEPDAHIAAQQHGLGHHGHLHAPDAEAGPDGARRQHVAHRLHGIRVRRRTPGNAEAELEHRRLLQQALLMHALGEPEMAGIEHLQLGLHAQLADPLGPGAQLIGRRDEDHVAVAEVQRAAVQRADLRQQLLDMHQALQRIDEIGAGTGLAGILVVDIEI